MPIIRINREAHNVLLASSPTEKTEGSMPISNGMWAVMIDDECAAMFNELCAMSGAADPSKAIIDLFS